MWVNVAGNKLSWEIEVDLHFPSGLQKDLVEYHVLCTDPSQNLMGPGRSINGAVAGVGVGVSSLSKM